MQSDTGKESVRIRLWAKTKFQENENFIQLHESNTCLTQNKEQSWLNEKELF